METTELINELHYYQMYLGEFLSDFEINEAICDLYEENKVCYNQYGLCLGNISSALSYRQHMLCYLLFYNDSDGKSIPKLINRIKDTKIVNDKELSKDIKNIVFKLDEPFSKAENDIDNLKEYRHNVYAHWNKKVFNTDWQQEFTFNHQFNYDNILELSIQCFKVFSEILILLGSEPFEKSLVSNHSIEFLLNRLKK